MHTRSLQRSLSHLVYGAERPGPEHSDLLELRLFKDAHLGLVGQRAAGSQRLHKLLTHRERVRKTTPETHLVYTD